VALVTVLQLDTTFPRVAGDVASPQTYTGPIEVLRIPNAGVDKIVSTRPDLIDIAPFEDAIQRAKGDIIVTSCGFLSYWQTHLADLTDKPFISSALVGLAELADHFTPHEVLTVTFDQRSLTPLHFGQHPEFHQTIAGLPNEMHLKQVIAGDLPTLDTSSPITGTSYWNAPTCPLIKQRFRHKQNEGLPTF